MSCLNFDELLRSIADDSAEGTLREHVGGCSACRRTAACLAAVFRQAALYEEFLAGASQKMPSRWARLIAERVHAAFEAQFAARPTCPRRDELFDWIVGGREYDAAIGAHVGVCVRCQQALGEITALINGASQWDIITAPPAALRDEPMPIELSDRVFATVNAAYEEQFAAVPERIVQSARASWRRFSRTGGVLAVAASVMLAVGGIVWQVRSSGVVTEVDLAARDAGAPVVKSPDLAAGIAPIAAQSAPLAFDGKAKSASPAAWTRLVVTAATAGSQLGGRAEPWLAMFRGGIRTPTADDWSNVAAQLVDRAKRARQEGRTAEEERLLVDALAVAKAGEMSAARQAAYGLLLVRNRLDQDRPDAALAAYEELPEVNAADIRQARQHIAGRLAKTFHERGRSAPAVMLLASLETDLDAPAAKTLADARRAVAARTTRLVGTGNQALTYKIEHWAQTRLASSIAQMTQ